MGTCSVLVTTSNNAAGESVAVLGEKARPEFWTGLKFKIQ